MPERKPDVLEIYNEYTRLRESGATPDDAVVQLKPYTGHFSAGDLNTLGKMVQVWEARQGVHYKPMPAANPPPKDDWVAQVGIKPVPRKLEKQNDGQPIRRIAPPLQAEDDPGQRLLCPNCNRPNKRGEMYCYACGEILQAVQSRSATRALDDDDPETKAGTTYFGQYTSLLLFVKGANKPLEGRLEGEAIIGRSAPDSPMRPDIDLAAFEAEKWGISRLHATFKVQNNTLSIMDMDSKNHTYINGQRLYPHEVRVLHDGDEIRLGRMPIRVAFKHQPRRLDPSAAR